MMFTNTIVAISAVCSVAMASPMATVDKAADSPTFYLIRHAEKNSDGTISSRGMQREQCLVKLFGKDSKYNIQHIMVQTPHSGGKSIPAPISDARTQRPYNTTLPLAQSLGITIDHPCEYTDPSCAGKRAREYTGPGNVLIAWEHVYLPKVAAAIGGAKNVPENPSSHFDYIYNLPSPYTKVTITSESCPGLDN
ncbi:hypothetical protein VHEMI07741 [[Torrubiella] hemipterigena]|uniref:Phosphoglycerate mutase family protein n=1 Tax=[Torrubiella] hemipterigena TaxID=1531966 RepID=A0A0A1TM70_9HYPO|nr:hypothetical protein VHEMI07741 [[Torrubiella] hemipterigena]